MPTTTFPPILIWQPGGGTPIGPVSNPPVYSQNGTTQLIQGQAYIDVVFGSVQTTPDWVLATCEIENTTDLSPLNIWPGIITNRTAAGFRLQLNGMPDSNHYYLHWAVSGVNIVPVQATSYRLYGPASGSPVDAIFTVALYPSTTLPGNAIVILSDGGTGGTFNPATVTLSNAIPTQTVVYTPGAYGTITISSTNNMLLTDPVAITYTVLKPTYSLTGPTTGNSAVPSTPFTLTLSGPAIGTVHVTPADAGIGTAGTFSPSTVSLTTAAPSATFTYTPASGGVKTISVTNDGTLTNPPSLSYTSIAPFAPTDIAGCKLWLKADSLALTDGATVTAWADSSGNGNNFTNLGSPIYKTNIVNSKPVVRFDGATNGVRNTAASIVTGNYTIFIVAKAASISAGSHTMFATGDSVLGEEVIVRRDVAVLNHFHFDGGFPVATEAGAIVAGAWNYITSDWGGVSIHLWRNGTLKSTVGPGSTSMPNSGVSSTVGYSFSGGNSQFYDGDIAEVLVYNSSLSSTDRGSVETFLATKYGL